MVEFAETVGFVFDKTFTEPPMLALEQTSLDNFLVEITYTKRHGPISERPVLVVFQQANQSVALPPRSSI
jgi:hypothetical protein